MSRPVAAQVAAQVIALAAALAVGACAESPGYAPATGAAELVVRRGELAQRVLLTGQLEAVSSQVLATPRTRAWQVSIRWMAEDGARVEAGQPVVEFDNAELVSRLEEKRLAALQAENALTRQIAEDAIVTADKTHAVAQRKVELQKAELEAGVPADLVARRDHEERQLELERARVALAQAEDELAAHRESAALAARIRRIEVDSARRDIEAAEAELDDLVLSAPRDGVLVVAEHPWEGRKLQVGDTLWPGMPVVEIPDLSDMQITATLFDVDDGRIEAGMKATCVLDAYPHVELAGEVTDISPLARAPERDSLLRAHRVTIALAPPGEDNEDEDEDRRPERMRPGMSVKVMVHARAARDRVIAPRAGLDLDAAPPRAYPAQGDPVEVDIDFCTARACVIADGLQPGTRLRRVAAPDRIPARAPDRRSTP